MSEEKKFSRLLTVTNKMGIHARPAAMIVRIANKYGDTEVWVRKEDDQVNGKSIMGLKMLAAGNKAKIHVTASGPNAEKVLKELETLFSRNFDEA